MRERAVARTILALLSLASASPSFAAYSDSDYASVISAKDARVDQLRNREIQQLQVVLSRNLPQDQQPDLLLRLAELYTEKYHLLFLEETEIWQKKIDAYFQLGTAAQKKAPRPTIDNGGSRQWLSKAVQASEKILALRLRYEKMDEVYYYLGFNNWELGNKRQSADYFSQIADHFPKSRYAPEAFRYIGDYAFGERNFTKASKFYKSASQIDSPARSRVLYGLAWCEFKLQRYKSATETMRQAIEVAKAQGDGNNKGISLQRDAFDALALFYSESGDAGQAGKYFGSLLNKADLSDALRKLAANYQRQGRFSQALVVNKQLVEMGGAAQKAGDEQRYSILLDSVRVAGNSGDRNREAALVKTMVAEFIVSAKEPDLERYEQIRTMVRKAAMLAHQEGNKSKDAKPLFARAEDLYRVYLSAFGNKLKAEEVWEIRYLLADAISQQGKNAEAAKEFQSILNAGEKNPSDPVPKKYQKDSALGLIYALDAALKEEKRAWSVEESDQLIGAIDTYARFFPKEKDIPKYLARSAGVLVTSKRMAEARPRLEYLAKNYPASREGLDAAVLLTKDAEDTQAWDRVDSLSSQFLASQALMAQDKKGELRAQLENVKSRAKFKEVKSLEDGKNYAQAAQQYEALAAQSKDKEVRFKALNNAAVSYEKSGDIKNELRVYESLIQNYPQDEKASKTILGLGNAAFLNGDFANACLYFERYFLAFEPVLPKLNAKRQQETLETLRTAAYLREAIGQANEANENLKHIVATANKGLASAREIAEEVLARTADRLRQLDNKVEALRAYQRYVQSFPDGRSAGEANLQSGLLYADLQDQQKSRASLARTIQIGQKRGKQSDPKTLSAAAHARLLQVQAGEERFFQIPLRLPEAKLKEDISAKLKAMDELVKGYVEVVDMGDGTWGVEALLHMANVYRNFGESLENAPVPQEYSAEDKAKFKAQLKQIAGPVYQKMSDTLENALRTGETLYVAGPSMMRVYLTASLGAARADRLPLAYRADWTRPDDWLSGERPKSDDELKAKRELLKVQPENAAAWVAIGNSYLLQGKADLARVFFLRALDANKKSVSAISNLAYLEGRAGNFQQALAGFRTALEYDEFSLQAKKNLARLYMASGLWRHASLAYRQLEVRAPTDAEVKQGSALCALAAGKSSLAEAPLADTLKSNDANGIFAKAILQLAKNSGADARETLSQLAGKDQNADLVLKAWKK